MTKRKHSTKTTISRNTRKTNSRDSTSARDNTLYHDYIVWTGKKAPQWHPVKKMRYVFFRMIGGCTPTDAIDEIHWNPAEFWHLVDLKKRRHDPFREEYKRAKILMGRACADSVVVIAEGRDKTTKQSLRRLQKLIDRGFRKARRQKSAMAVKIIMENLLAQIDRNEHGIIARNKLQIDAAKWIAKTNAPSEFAEQSKMTVVPTTPDGKATKSLISIQFVGPTGKVMSP